MIDFKVAQLQENLYDAVSGKFEPAYQGLERVPEKYPWSILFLLDTRAHGFEFEHVEVGSPDESLAGASNLARLFPPESLSYLWVTLHGSKILSSQPQKVLKTLRDHADEFNQLLIELEDVSEARPNKDVGGEVLFSLQTCVHRVLVEGSGLADDWEYETVA